MRRNISYPLKPLTRNGQDVIRCYENIANVSNKNLLNIINF